jgi:hypothetical protein
MSLTLWQLSDAYRDALHERHFDPETGALLPEAEALLAEIEEPFDMKALNIGAMTREWALEESALRKQADVLRDRADVLKRRRTNRLEYLERELAAAGRAGQNLSDDRVSIKWRESSRVEVLDEDAVDDEFFTTTRKVSKSRLKVALKLGPVDGAELNEYKKMSIK